MILGYHWVCCPNYYLYFIHLESEPIEDDVDLMERGKTFESPIVESTKEVIQEKVEPIEEEIEPATNYDESHESNAQPFISVNFPTIEELKIIRNTKLASVYNHFVNEGKVGLVSFLKLNIAHANTYVFKLRRMLKKYDIVITTHLDDKKKFVECFESQTSYDQITSYFNSKGYDPKRTSSVGTQKDGYGYSVVSYL